MIILIMFFNSLVSSYFYVDLMEVVRNILLLLLDIGDIKVLDEKILRYEIIII